MKYPRIGEYFPAKVEKWEIPIMIGKQKNIANADYITNLWTE
jgi:hypothetical protein